MAAIASIVVALSVVVLIYAAFMKRKASRVTNAQHLQTGAVAGAQSGSAVSVQGTPVGQQMVSPVTGTPCLYYELEVEGFWKEGDNKKSKKYLETKQGQVGVDDGSGVVPLDLARGGDFDLRKTFEETKKEGFFDDLKNAVGAKKPIVFGNFNFENPVGSKANEFRCIEKVFAPQTTVYAAGWAQNGVLTRKGIFSLLVSDKTRDEVLAAATGAAKKAFMGGAIGVGVGVLLGVVSAFV